MYRTAERGISDAEVEEVVRTGAVSRPNIVGRMAV